MGANSKIKLAYILGNSRSGSTILGIKLGLHPAVTFLGELKLHNNSFRERECICGKLARDCPYWQPIIQANPEIFKRKVDSDYGLYRFFKTLLSLLGYIKAEKKDQEKKYLSHIRNHILDIDPECTIMVDSSKSLSRFIQLTKMEDVTIFPIYIERNFKDNLSSFVKRGKGFLSSFLRLRTNQLLFNFYFKRSKLKIYKISYEDYVNNPRDERKKIFSFLKIEEENFIEKPLEKLHQFSGSSKTRSLFKVSQEVKGDMNRKNYFTPTQQFILKLLRVK